MRKLELVCLAVVVVACGERHEAGERTDKEQRVAAARATYGDAIRTRIERARGLDRTYRGLHWPPIGDAVPRAEPPATRDTTDILAERDLLMFQSGALAQGAKVVSYTPDGRSADDLVADLELAARVTYVAVMRPSWVRPANADLTDHTYSANMASADVVVFDLRTDPPRAIGAFHAVGQLTDKVRVRAGEGSAAVQQDLDRALDGACYDAVRTKLGP